MVYQNMIIWYDGGHHQSGIGRMNFPKSILLVTYHKYPHIVYMEHERMDHHSDRTTIVVGEKTTTLEGEVQLVNSDGADVVFHMIDDFFFFLFICGHCDI
uniref:Uncharacterized protein n=1 Tax=Salix viminalis TaxID=40686 RepID=A0A6N2MR22_SALVM